MEVDVELMDHDGATRGHDYDFIELRQAFSGNLKTYYLNNFTGIKDICLFLTFSKSKMVRIINNYVQHYGALKFNIVLEATYQKPLVNLKELRSFKTKNYTVLADTNINSLLHAMFQKICTEEQQYEGKGSGWTLQNVDGIMLRLTRYRPLGGSSYICLPSKIVNKKAVVNPKNLNDNRCFLWALLSKHIRGHERNRVNKRYYKLKNKFNIKGIDFPTPCSQIKKFEQNNPGISINVYGLDSKNDVYPLVVSDCVGNHKNHYDLLYITDGNGRSHYCFIASFSRLVDSQVSRQRRKLVFCKRCFTKYGGKDRESKLKYHIKSCCELSPVRIEMPSEDQSILKFKNYHHRNRLPFVVYADFECILKPINQRVSKYTKIDSIHEPMSFAIYLVVDNDLPDEIKANLPQDPYIYRGKDAAKKFMSHLISLANDIGELLKDKIPMMRLSDEENCRYRSSTHCEWCNSEFTMLNNPVRDHCHISGRFRAVLCNECNLKARVPTYLPVFIHGSSNYDSHFIVRQLGCDEEDIHVIPNSSERYITFSKKTVNGIKLRFVDTYRFMSSSLSELANTLSKEKFVHTKKAFPEKDISLITRKGVYCYDYTDSWEKLEELHLPPKEVFYNSLEERKVTDSDYSHARDVWDAFNCGCLGDYSDVYLLIDVLILSDVFENFRDLSMSNYELDCAYYITLPSLTFDAMLKFTKVELELFKDYDKYLFIERGIRGGITSCIKKYAKANIPKLEDHFDSDKPTSYLTYIDANNLYGHSMMKPMPVDSFKWKTDNLQQFDVLSISDDSPTGYILEVDVEYPTYLHNDHNELPFFPVSKCPLGSKQPKLLTTLETKTNYIVHYINLKQGLKHGLVLKKIHKILQFNQTTWLAPYVEYNTKKRINASNEFEKDFYKFIINAMFGKTIENVRKRRNISLVTSQRKLDKLVNKPTFYNRIIYNETLCAIENEKECLYLDKPIYLGFTVLELSKVHMYFMHYEIMKQMYRSHINLLYIDTDSLIYEIITDNVYKDIKCSSFKRYFDMSDLPITHEGYFCDNKKQLGYFKDECKGLLMLEFIGLRPKLYCFKLVDDYLNETIKKKAKGVKRAALQNRLNFNDFKTCLDKFVSIRTTMKSFVSKKHIVKTITYEKLALDADDDKRVVCNDGINTLAYGHYKLKELYRERRREALQCD